jgi:hypothetical protein
MIRALTLLGEKDPESWLKQQDPPVPPLALEMLAADGAGRAAGGDPVRDRGGAAPRSAAAG